jgi:hypothetical protein
LLIYLRGHIPEDSLLSIKEWLFVV